MRKKGFHVPKKERTGFEHELQEAKEGYFRNQSYAERIQTHYPEKELERSHLSYQGSEEWYEIMLEGKKDGQRR